MKKLYSFYWDCGRMGSVESLFISEDRTVDSAIGKELYFGEILGKHSEIYGVLKPEDLTVLSEDQEKIEWLISVTGVCVSGYNPLDYLSDMYDDEEGN